MADFKKQILAILQNIQTPGSFVSYGAEPFVFPGVVVKGVGEISFPIPVVQIKQLIGRAHKAPFGKGAQTLLDITVRSAWEIDAAAIRFTNKDWKGFVQAVVEKAKVELGVAERQVAAHFYKLLIYEKGDFFLPHQDSEKEAGMFGTLIIGLPSSHEGGKLLVQFDGKTRTVDFSGPAKKYQLSYAAFYADCVHEVKPIRSGYRLCLVYNLVHHKNKEKIQLRPLSSPANRLAAILKTVEEDKDMPKIVLLGHQYTPSNFTTDALKLHDHARAEALLQAAEQAGFYAKLGLVTSYQMGELLGDDEGWFGYARRSRFYDEDEDEEGEATMGEVYKERIEIEHWMLGGLPPLRDLTVQEKDLITPMELHEDAPLQKEATGYTGNEGMEMEYWYHYGAVILWPRKQHYELLKVQPVENKLEWIAYYNQQGRTIALADASLIKRLTENDLPAPPGRQELNADPLAQWLIRLNDEGYLARKGEKILEAYFYQISEKSWVSLFRKYPAFGFQKAFTAAGLTGELKKIAHLLTVLSRLHAADRSFDPFIRKQTEKLPAYIGGVKLTVPDAKELAGNILRETLALDAIFVLPADWLDKTSEAFTRQLSRAFVNEVLIAVLLQADKRSRLAVQILKKALDDLKKRVAKKPLPPANWSRAVPPGSGYDSKVWKILAPFLTSPTERVFDYKKIQSERSNMEHAIRRVPIDLSIQTIRKGSPHTLRITKTQAAYEQKLTEWNKDVALLKKVESKFSNM